MKTNSINSVVTKTSTTKTITVQRVQCFCGHFNDFGIKEFKVIMNPKCEKCEEYLNLSKGFEKQKVVTEETIVKSVSEGANAGSGNVIIQGCSASTIEINKNSKAQSISTINKH